MITPEFLNSLSPEVREKYKKLRNKVKNFNELKQKMKKRVKNTTDSTAKRVGETINNMVYNNDED